MLSTNSMTVFNKINFLSALCCTWSCPTPPGKIHVFPMEQVEKKNFFFEVGVFKGDVLKQMFQKGYRISFRMHFNLCNAKFSIIDVENRVIGKS